MNTLTVGQVMTGDQIATGDNEDFLLKIFVAGKYVLETTGPAELLTGIWGPYPPGTDEPEPDKTLGRLRVCGVGKRGVRMLTPGIYLVRATLRSASSAFTIKVRAWSFFDYATIDFYKSSC